MPSKAFEILAARLAERAMQQPTDITAERAIMAQYASAYQPLFGVTDEPIAALRPVSYLMTPERPRDDAVILLIHGGGFRIAGAGLDRLPGSWLAEHTKARVVVPEYRLAPENPYPAGLQDCLQAFEYAATLAPKVVLAGSSAGANLAVAVLLTRVAAGDRRLVAGVLHSGVFDLRPQRYQSGSWVENLDTELVLLDNDGPAIRSQDYLGGHDPADPFVSPILANCTGLPPLFIQASGAERLLDDSLALASAAAKAGVHVELEVWPHMSHGWQMTAGHIPEATEAMRRTGAFIERVLAGRVVDGEALLDQV